MEGIDLMRFLRMTLVFLTLAVAASAAQNLEFAATPYEAPAFLATFPVPDKNPTTYTSENVTLKNGGTATMHNYTLSIHNDADAFLVLYSDVPNIRGDATGLDLMLDGALATMDNSKPGPKTDSIFSGLPARTVTATGTYKNGQTTYSVTTYERIAVQGSRIWQGIVICDSRTNCSEGDANKFFNSIKVR